MTEPDPGREPSGPFNDISQPTDAETPGRPPDQTRDIPPFVPMRPPPPPVAPTPPVTPPLS